MILTCHLLSRWGRYPERWLAAIAKGAPSLPPGLHSHAQANCNLLLN